MTDAAATTTRGRASAPTVTAAGEPSPAVKVQQVAARAAEAVAGVHELGTPGGRALVRAMGRVPGGRTTYGPGVSVEVGERKAAVDVSLVVEFGSPAPTVAGEVREAVRDQVQRDAGLEVVEVNVTVVGLHHPDDDIPVEPEEAAVPAESPAGQTGTAPGVDPGADPAQEGVREAGEEVERIVARAVEDVAEVPSSDGRTPDAPEGADTVRDGGAAPTVVVATADGETPDVVVADQVVLADSVVVVDPEQDDEPTDGGQQHDQQHEGAQQRQD